MTNDRSRSIGRLVRRSAVAGVFAAFTLAGALAGEINDVDGAKSGAAIKGYDPVAYFTDGKPVEGSPNFTMDYKGATFQFASAENRATFAAAPDKYAPQFGGFCAYGTSRGYKADIDPAAFTVVDGKLYLNHSKDVQTTWVKDIPGYLTKANAAWPEVIKHDEVRGRKGKQ